MATIESFGITYKEARIPRAEGGLWSGLIRSVSAIVRRSGDRRALVQISRLDPHIIRDMGFDPDAIYAALEGSWDEVEMGRFKRR
jgi:hypothetical protein